MGPDVLVLDPDDGSRRFLEQRLGQDGLTVASVSTLAEGVHAARTERPWLVVTSGDHPEGLLLCRELKSDPALADLLVVVVAAGTPGAPLTHHWLNVGSLADLYVRRPLGNAFFGARLERWLADHADTVAMAPPDGSSGRPSVPDPGAVEAISAEFEHREQQLGAELAELRRQTEEAERAAAAAAAQAAEDAEAARAQAEAARAAAEQAQAEAEQAQAEADSARAQAQAEAAAARTAEQELARSRTDNDVIRVALEQGQGMVAAAKAELAARESELAAARDELAAAGAALDAAQGEIAAQAAEITTQAAEITTQAAEITTQAAEITAQAAEITSLRAERDALAAARIAAEGEVATVLGTLQGAQDDLAAARHELGLVTDARDAEASRAAEAEARAEAAERRALALEAELAAIGPATDVGALLEALAAHEATLEDSRTTWKDLGGRVGRAVQGLLQTTQRFPDTGPGLFPLLHELEAVLAGGGALVDSHAEALAAQRQAADSLTDEPS